ncbi:hypothetical protein SD71_17385 [Cohnella kolymensis]|uniref:Uncharacterized protein n=1 Tax=Cohnella kolymensis TaxID=1590652 RepID=A0ABR5A165_9BACL|nr:hypothetical protein [Cohnella kolymensis]KIL34798.1 hypothetical protein SD71_17385 [Cohnella kolymensis]
MTLILFLAFITPAAIGLYFLLKPPISEQVEPEYTEETAQGVIIVEPIIANTASHVSPLTMNQTVGK